MSYAINTSRQVLDDKVFQRVPFLSNNIKKLSTFNTPCHISELFVTFSICFLFLKIPAPNLDKKYVRLSDPATLIRY